MEEHPEAARPLAEMKPLKKFFVGIDSDGCAFDTMEPKHKECFCPNFVRAFNLAAVSKYAREVWEFVNLYSIHRGCNRWHALMLALDLLRERTEVRQRGVKIPEFLEIKKFIASGLPLSNSGLCEYMRKVSSPQEGKGTGSVSRPYAKRCLSPFLQLAQARDWTEGLNQAVAATVRDVPPFPFVRESLQELVKVADVVVVSATPGEALSREWEEHQIASYARVIAGQEMGTKAEHLKLAAAGKYPKGNILMIGDALGDLKAARSVEAQFFPINPGHEVASWELFLTQGLHHFVGGKYAGAYEENLIAEFRKHLPEKPPWA